MSAKRKRAPSRKVLDQMGCLIDDGYEDGSNTESSPVHTQPTEPIIIPDGDWPEHQLIADEFSDILKSRTIKVVVQNEHSFFVHEELLCRASDKFQKQLKGQFREAHTGEIQDCDEDPTYFFLFLKYLYKGKVVLREKVHSLSQFVLWANLYCMGDRLEAQTFQAAIFTAFSDGISSGHPPSNSEICDVLLLLHNGLPERIGFEYPLRNLVFWYAATKLATLKQHFISGTNLLSDYPVLATKILMWASPNLDRKPSLTSDPPEVYFRKKKDSARKDSLDLKRAPPKLVPRVEPITLMEL